MNLGTKKQNFSYQLGAQQLQISLKQKPVCVSLFINGKNNVTSDNKSLPFERENIKALLQRTTEHVSVILCEVLFNSNSTSLKKIITRKYQTVMQRK